MYKKCPVCELDFKVQPHAFNRRTYCSRECMSKAYNKRIEKTCLVCEKKFKVPDNIHRRDAKFCSRACSGIYMSGEKHWNYQHGYGDKGSEEQRRQWREKHRSDPENRKKHNEHVRKLKLKHRNVEGGHTLEEWEALVEKYNHSCFYCGEKTVSDNSKKQLTRDHVIPIEKGGTDYIENIVPACKTCNSKKGNKTIEEVFGELQSKGNRT